VDDSLLVRALQGSHHGEQQLDGAHRGQALAAQQLLERLTLEVLQHHEGPVSALAHLMDDDDVLVAAQRGGARLEDEAPGELGILGVEELDGHAAAQPGVAGQVDRAHASPAQLPDELVVLDEAARRQRGLLELERGGIALS
jgi:NADPH-dependent ferric siderophore reductase